MISLSLHLLAELGVYSIAVFAGFLAQGWKFQSWSPVTYAVAASEGLMSILGWEVSFKPLKYLPFLPQFVSLGVQFDSCLRCFRRTSW